MIILENVSLKVYTSIKIGGIAEKLLLPETPEELIETLNNMKSTDKPFYILGGGSNVLINDQKKYPVVICLKRFDKRIEFQGENQVKVGASVMLPYFINMINRRSLGGIEYLYSVPGTVGGAIAMNAGRGRKYGQSISDYLESVEVWEKGEVKTYSKEEGYFEYRNSKFKNSDIVILNAIFKFDSIDTRETEKRKKQRIQLCKEVQDNSYYNFGSVFAEYDYTIMNLIKHTSFRKAKGAFYSHKTINWMLNNDGTYNEVIKKVELAEKIHRYLHKKIRREFITWQ